LYQTYKKRFWNHIDFTDDRILRTPVYHAMLNRYINQFVMQIPDTIIAASDYLLEKTRANKEMFRYTLWYLTNNAERSQIMGMDAVFVHLVEKYYNTGEAFWISPEGLERISKRASTLAPILIGRTAPNINGFDVNGEQKALHDVEADYLVLYFWESNCAHCREETPVLKDIHEKYHQHGFEVFAMNVETEPENWKEAMERYNASWINVNDVFNRSGYRETYDVYAIPLIYLLDKDKKIIAKKISAGQLDDFMQFELNRMKEAGSD
jgi:thiol-disulfide isomerase/thioredoxin